LTNFPNGKQTQESLESGFPESEFRETNMAYILKHYLYLIIAFAIIILKNKFKKIYKL